MFEFEVDIGSWTRVGAFVELAKWAVSFFGQQAIAIKIAGVPEIILAPAD